MKPANLDGDMVFTSTEIKEPSRKTQSHKKRDENTQESDFASPFSKKPQRREHQSDENQARITEISTEAPLNRYSAKTRESLQRYADIVREKQATIEIIKDSVTGYVLREPSSKNAAERLDLLFDHLNRQNILGLF